MQDQFIEHYENAIAEAFDIDQEVVTKCARIINGIKYGQIAVYDCTQSCDRHSNILLFAEESSR